MGGLRHISASACAALAVASPCAAAPDAADATAWPQGAAVVSYESVHALEAALARQPATVLLRLPELRIAVVRPAGDVARYATRLDAEPGIDGVERRSRRHSLVEPALVAAPGGAPLQWQYAAIGADRVPADVAAAASRLTIAVVDTGADLTAPDLAVKAPAAASVRPDRSLDLTDPNGHGTFVAALAAGSGSNGNGIAGVAGDARLLIVQAGGVSGSFTDVEEAAAIVAAVDGGAKIVNLSLGGSTTSTVERRAIEYAVAKGVLLVAAVGNGGLRGNPVEYPAALLQPPGSRGTGGRGLAVAASTRAGARAAFSTSGGQVSLAAPGAGVFSAVSAASPRSRYPRVALPGATSGQYGFGSGTSFAAPQVAGAAALVWAANPALTAGEVAALLEETASGDGSWTPGLGYGVVDAAAAVERARALQAGPALRVTGSRTGTRVEVEWPAIPAASTYRVLVTENGGAPMVLTPATTATSAAFDLTRGSLYGFTVSALAADGSELARSAVWSVSLRRAATRLSLDLERLGTQRVALRARLSGAVAPRTVVLESFDGTRWSRAATGRTGDSGEVVWRFTLARGTYRVRARFAGTDELAPSLSPAVSIAIR